MVHVWVVESWTGLNSYPIWFRLYKPFDMSHMTYYYFTYVADRIVEWINNLKKGHFGVPFWSMRIR